MEDIKFPLEKREKTFPLQIKITGYQEEKTSRAQKYLFCGQPSKLVGSAIRRHFEDRVTKSQVMCIPDKWVLCILGTWHLDLFGGWE